jgi:hypothetical protein
MSILRPFGTWRGLRDIYLALKRRLYSCAPLGLERAEPIRLC